MEFMPHARPGLHVPHAGQEQGGHDVAVAKALLDPRGNLFKKTVSRRLFQQADQGFDLRLEPHDLRVEGGLGGRDRTQSRQKAKVAKSE